MSDPGWLKSIDLSQFHNRLWCLYKLGHFLDYSEDWEDIKRTVTSEGHSWFRGATYSLQAYSGRLVVGERGKPEYEPLKQDEIFGPVTQRSVQDRFCGAADRVSEAGGKPKWGRNQIRVWHDMQAWSMSFERCKQIWMGGWQMIAKVCKLNADWTESGRPDVYAHARRIDGPNRTLAWSFLPNSPDYQGGALEQRYDTSDFLSVSLCAHENGHAAGLGHAPNRDNVMYASYTGKEEWGEWDTKELQDRYGEPNEGEEPPPPTGELEERVAALEVSVERHASLLEEALYENDIVKLTR